jgi:2,3-bisphosphoglycerate-dependent phosphoglycerate mutase
MRLFIVRHGQTSWNVLGRAQGHTDIGLNETGRDQANQLAKQFTDTGIGELLCSDLSRAIDTARPISEASGVPLSIRKELRERKFGEWEGKSFAAYSQWVEEVARAENLPITQIRPKGGESFQDVWRRLDPIVAEIDSTSQNLAVVSHGGTCSMLLAKLLLGTVESSRSFRFKNATVTELNRRADGYYQLIRYADDSHLHSDAGVTTVK